MATYITLVNFTPKGVENIKESPKRLEATKEVIQSFGGRLKGFYLALGRYDIILITEAPDDKAVAKAALAVGSRGAVKTETFRVFDEGEYRDIIKGLP